MSLAIRRDDQQRDAPPETLAVICYRRTWRLVAAALVAASAVGILLVLARIVRGGDPPLTVIPLLLLAVTMVAVPAVVAALLRRTFAAGISVDGDSVVVTRRDLRLEIPRSAIVAIEPWTIPLPTAGATMRLRSGAPFGWELGLETPRMLPRFLVDRAAAGPRTDVTAPAFLHADARGAAGTLRWWQWLLKFPLLGLVPTMVVFNAHQWIAYGGTFGEYYQYGARPYLLTFLDYWTTVTIYLTLWAGAWRVLAEVVAWGVSRLAPGATVVVRRVVEAGCRVLYYGGVPVLLALRFMP